MSRQEIIEDLGTIFIDVLDLDEVSLTESTTADEIEEWDSLGHIQMIVAVEKKFSVRFTAKEIENFNNIGDLVSAIESKK